MGLEKNRIVDPVLTNIARGYVNGAFIGTRIAPVVRVQKEGGKIPQFGKDAFKIYETQRAIRARSNRMSPSEKSTIDYVMAEHDLEYPVDYREADEDMFNLRDYARKTVQDGVLLKQEYQIGSMVADAANYAESNKDTLSGTDQVSDTANCPLITMIKDYKETFRSMLGVRPNLMWMGASVFAKATENAKVLDRMKYTQVAVPTAADLARLFEIPEVLVGDAVYCDDEDVFHDVWGDSMGLCYVPKSQNANQYEPSFMYTLAKKNGQFVDSYFENGGKLELIRYTDIFVEKMVGAEAGFLISDCIADE